MSTPSIAVVMDYEKQTKNTVRYVERTEIPKLGVLYIPKASFEEKKFPATIAVQVAWKPSGKFEDPEVERPKKTKQQPRPDGDEGTPEFAGDN